MVELLIVVCIIGALTSVAVPLFIENKEKATLGVTKANLAVVRAGLAQHAAKGEGNLYPSGVMGYGSFRIAVPECNLPPIEAEAKFVAGSFMYSSDGTTYLVRATAPNRSSARFRATATGISAE